MDANSYKVGENEICNEVTIRQSLLRHSSQNRELSSASSISPSMSVSVGESSVISQFSAFRHENQIDRLTSSQGLIVPKERPNTLRRTIRDKSYYKGLIHLKSKEIKDELKKLLKEIGLLSVDKQMFIPYKEEAKSKAMDLQNLQKTLAEYNLLDDMLRRRTQLEEAKQELQALKAFNGSENCHVEKLFAMAEQKEKKVKEMESIISQENDVSEILTKTMDLHVSDRIRNLKFVDQKLHMLRIEQEEELLSLKKKRHCLENQCSQNNALNAQLELTKKLWSLKEKKNKFQLENRFASSQEEYKYLKKHQTECSLLLKGITHESQNIKSKIQITIEELKKIENESCNRYSNTSFKYSELWKQEGIINKFFSSYSDEQNELLANRQQKEFQIVELLGDISSKISPFGLDLQDEHGKIFFANDESITVKKKMEYLKAIEEWEDMKNLESKLSIDRDNLNVELEDLKNKILSASNIHKLKEDLKIKQTKLLNELNQVKKQKRAWKHILVNIKKYHDSLQKKLQKNETYGILAKLEKRWHLLEKENFVMENLIASKDFQGESLRLRNNVRKLTLELNNML